MLGDYHLIMEPTAKLLFDWRADPLERQNLFGTDPERDASIEQTLATRLARLAQARASTPAAASVEIDDQQRKRLHALGYVE